MSERKDATMTVRELIEKLQGMNQDSHVTFRPNIDAEPIKNPIVGTTTHTRDEKITCLRREIALRKSAYPKWVKAGRMTYQTADWEIAVMTAILEDYECQILSDLPAS